MKNRRMNMWMIVMFLFALVMVAGCEKKNDKSEEGEQSMGRVFEDTPLMIEPIANMREDFIRGVDISTLIEMEAHGQKYYNDQGVEEDLIRILSDHGVNWIRVRVWNDPYDVTWSADLTKDGLPVAGAIGGGTNDIDKAIALSLRAQQAGMKVLLDFHYSDFWADPGKQYKPMAWEGMSFEEMKTALYDFTYESLEKMAKAGCLPEMVQIGNEINHGLVWPEGKDITSQNAFELLEQGVLATRKMSQEEGKDIQIMIHLAEGGDRAFFVNAYDALTQKGLDYDIIGVSFYPYWHGTLTELQLNLKTLEERYGKEIIVAEVAYAYGFTEGDETGNIFNETMQSEGGYKATVQGQATAVRDVMAVVANVSNQKGLGVFYWEPAWLTPEGTGWLTGEGNGWENQAMFDINGKALPSLDVFYAVDKIASHFIEPTFVGIEPLKFKIDQGQKVSLPYRVQGLLSHDKYNEMTVKWQNLPINYNLTPGNYRVIGRLEDNDVEVFADIEVVESFNILTNGSFEEGLDKWVIDTAMMKLGKEGENPFVGKYALNYWAAQDFEGKLRYDIGNIENGDYELTAWIMGTSLGASSSKLIAQSGELKYEAQVEVSGFNDWKLLKISNIKVTDGTLEFGIDLKEVGGSWGWIDDVKLSPMK